MSYRSIILEYLKEYHNKDYTGCPSNKTIESDIFNLIEDMNDINLLSSFRKCKSTQKRLKFFNQYLTSWKNNKKKRPSLYPQRKHPPIEPQKISQSKVNGIPKKWVENKINQLEDDEKWRALRYQALKLSDGRCCLCGRSSHDGVRLHVDHIKPKSMYPELRFDLNNLQVLCEDCNMGKCNFDDTDWRHNPNKITSDENKTVSVKPKIFLIKKVNK